MDIYELLRELVETPGPSGFEAQIAEIVRNRWQPLTDEISIDRVGSLTAVKSGQGKMPRRRLLLAAHMDEIGLMVKQIVGSPDDLHGNGFIRVIQIGGVDVRQLYDQMVIVHGTAGTQRDLVGVLGALPADMLPDDRRGNPFSYDDLLVDVGLSVEELRQLVCVGDSISFYQPLRKLLNGRATGKALDNRASVAAVTVCLDYLRGRRHEWDVIVVATAQEETALLGAMTSAYAQRPDAAIAVDVTFGQGPGANDAATFELGGGPTVGLGPNVHPGVHQGLKEAASALEMKVHVEPHARFSGTDAFGLQVARSGVPTGILSIPLRYMHTMVETLALKDVERAGRLLGEFVARLDDRFLEQVGEQMMAD